MRLTGEGVLHVKRMHVELVSRKRSQLSFYVIDSWNWTSTNVV